MRMFRTLSDEGFKELNDKTFKNRFKEFFLFKNST